MKNIKYLSVLLMLSFLFVSCEKQPQESEYLTESSYCHICEDARINITASSGNAIECNVNCPSDEFNRTFEGRPCVTDDDFLINMTVPSGNAHPDYELTVYVYKNAQGKIRLHGFARQITYQIVNNPDGLTVYNVKSKVNYYFDVIKN